MGAVVNNNSTEILSPVGSPSAVEMHATVLSTVNPDNRHISVVDQNMETESTFIHTAIMVESVQTEKNSSTEMENKQTNFKTRFSSLVDSDSESDDNETCNITYTKPSRVNIFDSESENEDNNNTEGEKLSSSNETEDVKCKVKSTTKMTGKEAQIQRLEIASASQRRLRESRLSLPYHKPKQRTLKEFLKIRPKISDPVPDDLKNMSTVNAIKLASIRTTEISKKLEEREKILEKFYKSSSESETEENEKKDKLGKSVINTTNDEEKIQELNENDEEKIEELNENDLPKIQEINENSEMNKSSENNIEEPCNSIQGILDELKIDYSKFKHELIKSFLQPTKLIERMEADIKSFEDQDLEETELISEFELNKIIDTLNTEESSKTINNDQIMEIDDEVTSLKCDSNENIKSNQEKWTENKCFNELSDSEKEENDDAVMEQNDTELKENLHLTNIKSLTPRLTGDKNQIIDLSEDIFEKNKGVKNLVERFVQHNAKKSHSPKVLQFRVVTEDTGGFKEEKLTMETHHEDEDIVSPINEKPGAKLMRLREDLQKKIAKRRAEEWARKQKETKELLGVVENDEDEEEDDFDSIYKNEKDDCCSDKKLKDVDNGVDGDDEAEDVEDEEEEDVDYYKEKKSKKKSEFVDEEAEESGNEEDSDESEEEDVESEGVDEDKNEQNGVTEKNKVRRRIKELTEDSTDTENETLDENVSKKLPESTYQTQTEESPINKSQNDMFSTQSKADCDGDEFPLCQPPILKTPLSKRNICDVENNFLSPVQQFTALQSLSLDAKTIHQQSPNCTFTIPNEPSPLRNEKYSPKQLFCDSKMPNTQENLNELMELCSGKFSNSSQALTVPSQQQVDFTLTPDADWTTQRIITASQTNDEQQKSTQTSQENGNNLKLTENENNSVMKLFTSDDESEIELKKIMSTNTTNTPKPTKNELFLVASSSDDETEVQKIAKKQRKLVKKKPVKLFCSDDEDDDAENIHDNEINSNDDDSDDQGDEVEENIEETHEIDYDSEENEILVEKPKVTRVKDFFDAEAELSEDEHMGSDDESEDGLDEMEQEEGDRDKLNETEVKRQLEKIHMKQILDEDKRDVRILQELLLEDGDLHSDKGRQRQFRWKNSMDAGLGNDENVQPFDNDSEIISLDEDQDGDSEWRKARFEREKLLKEQRLKEKLDTRDIDLVIEGGDSILKLGQTKLRTSGVSSISCKRTSIEKSTSVINVSQDIKKPLGLTNKKGSFLTRGQSTLARLAAVATTKSTDIIGGVKNSRNFVFQTLDAPAVNGNNNIKNSDDKHVKKININGKRKATDLDTTPLMFKKLRVADSLDKKLSSRVKKLLNNL